MKEARIKFYVERTGFCTEASLIFMALAVVFRVIGCWGLWNDRFFLMTQILLPIASGLLFILLLALLGKSALWTTFLPVLGGVAFFVIKALGFENTTQMLLCLLLYAVVAILYCGTVFTLIRTKWLLVPLLLLPFCYHVGVEDIARLRDTANPVTFTAGMQEMSVLCIMLSLFFVSLAMKKLVKEPKEKAWAKGAEESAQEEKPAEKPAEQPAEPSPFFSPAAAEPAAENPETTATEE